MSPRLRAGSYGHRLRYLGDGCWRMSWKVDTKHGRIRYPRVATRDTDRKGAERFARRWGLDMPEPGVAPPG